MAFGVALLVAMLWLLWPSGAAEQPSRSDSRGDPPRSAPDERDRPAASSTDAVPRTLLDESPYGDGDATSESSDPPAQPPQPRLTPVQSAAVQALEVEAAARAAGLSDGRYPSFTLEELLAERQIDPDLEELAPSRKEELRRLVGQDIKDVAALSEMCRAEFESAVRSAIEETRFSDRSRFDPRTSEGRANFKRWAVEQAETYGADGFTEMVFGFEGKSYSIVLNRRIQPDLFRAIEQYRERSERLKSQVQDYVERH